MAKEDSLVVHEIYRSIQGESSFLGIPCTFVRLTGCNLRCRWCDTPQAFFGGTRMSRPQILDAVEAHGTDLVELTGGEPLLQPGALPLMTELADRGATVLLETSGERDIGKVDPRVHRIVDFKAPDSGESENNRWANVELLGSKDEAKFVIASRRDYDWSRDCVQAHRLTSRVGQVLFSAAFGRVKPRQLVEWVLEDRLPVRVQLQLHKVIWHPDKTGV